MMRVVLLSYILAIRISSDAESQSIDPLPSIDHIHSSDLRYEIPCDVTFENALCLKGGAHVVLPDSVPSGVIASYKFDSGIGLDSSGRQNHASGSFEITPGASFSSSGAMFVKDYLTTPISGLMHSFSITFYMLILKREAESTTCPIIAYGNYGSDTAFAISYDRSNGELQVSIPTSIGLEGFSSNSLLQTNTWYKLTYTLVGEFSSLYVDGFLDSNFRQKNRRQPMTSQITIGGSAFEVELVDCYNSLVLDDVTIYDHSLPEAHVEADSGTSGSLVSPFELRISCTNCTLAEAQEGCSDSHHLCTSRELDSSMAQVIRRLGLAKRNKYFHTIEGPQPRSPGIGLCCSD